MRCPCGFTEFVARIRRKMVHGAPRWFEMATLAPGGGMGFTPLGTAGLPGGKLYGRVDVDANLGALETRCRACGRVRAEKPVGGGALLGGWRAGNHVYCLMTDVADAACVFIRFRGEGTAFEAPIETVDVEVPESVIATVETALDLPPGAVVGDVIYRAAIPEGLTGEQRVLLVDRCLRTSSYVATIALEG